MKKQVVEEKRRPYEKQDAFGQNSFDCSIRGRRQRGRGKNRGENTQSGMATNRQGREMVKRKANNAEDAPSWEKKIALKRKGKRLRRPHPCVYID